MPLTDVKIRQAKATDKARKLAGSACPYLEGRAGTQVPLPRLGMRAVMVSTRGSGTGQDFYGLQRDHREAVELPSNRSALALAAL